MSTLQNTTYTASLAMKGSNQNTSNTEINNILQNFATTVSNGGIITLTTSNAQEQNLTGTMNQTYILPVANTGIYLYYWFIFQNESTGTITIQYQDTTTLTTVASDTITKVVLTSIATANGTWQIVPQTGSSSGGTVTTVSVVSANGLAGTVATATTTPAITLAPTFTGITYSTGTALRAALSADFPTLNQNTTGTANSVTGTNVINNSNLVQATSNTWKGNNTGTTANISDNSMGNITETGSSIFTISGTNTVLNNATIKANLTSSDIYVGNSSNVPVGVTMTGDVNISNTGNTTIQSGVVTNSKLSPSSPNTWKGNNGISSATPSDWATAGLTESTSSVLTISGASNALLNAATIQVKQASTSQGGYLGSTDYTLFKNLSQATYFANIASTSNISGTFSSGSFTGMPNTAIDGVTPTTGMLVLLPSQTSSSQNGLYTITNVGTGSNGTWTRTYTTDSTIRTINIFVQSGTAYQNTLWANTNWSSININTDPIYYSMDIENQSWLPACYLCSIVNITTLSGSQTIDGVATGTGVLVLLTAQTTITQNGVWWIPPSGAWVRPSFFTGIIPAGMVVNIRYTNGGQNYGLWEIVNSSSGSSGTINVGTDNIACNHIASEALMSSWISRNTAGNLPLLNASGLIQNIQSGGGFTTTVTAAGTTTLTLTSTRVQQFTGTTTQTLVLPAATTLLNGNKYTVENLSTGAITVNMNGGTTLLTVPPNSSMTITLTSNATSAGTWYIPAVNTSWTPADGSGASLTLTVNSASYSQISNIVNITSNITYPSTASASAAVISGLPLPAHGICIVNILSSAGTVIFGKISASGTTIALFNATTGAAVTNVTLSTATITISGTYSN